MKKLFLCTFLILSIFITSSAKKVSTNKVVTHLSAAELSEGEYAVIKVPANITVTELMKLEFLSLLVSILLKPDYSAVLWMLLKLLIQI